MTLTYRPLPTVLGVSPHGVLAALGIAVGAWLLLRRLRLRGLPTTGVEAAVEVGVLGGIVGARTDYVLSHPGQFSSVGQVLAVWQGGLALFGGLIAGVGAALFMLHRRKAPALAILDVAVPSFAVAIAIGRIGDLLLTDHLGRPTTSPFALRYLVQAGYHLAPGFGPSPAVAPGAGESCADVGRFYAGCTYHLSAAYDMLGAVLLAGLLLWLARRRLRDGLLAAVFGVWYGMQRLLLDFTRGVDERAVGLTGTQWLAIGLLVASVTALVIIGRRSRAGRPLDSVGGRPQRPASADSDPLAVEDGAPERRR